MDLAERDRLLLGAIERKLFVVYEDRIVNAKTKKILGKHTQNKNSPLNFAFDGNIIVAKRARFLWLYSKGAVPANYMPMIADHNKPITVDNIKLVAKKHTAVDHTAINKNQRLTDEQVKALREEYTQKSFSLIERAVSINLSITTIHNLLVGNSYKHVGGPIVTSKEISQNNKRHHKTVTATFTIYERDQAFLALLKEGHLCIEGNKVFNGKNGRELAGDDRRDNQAVTGKYKNIHIAIMKTRLLWLFHKGSIPEGYRPTRKDPKGPVTIDNIHLVNITEFCKESGAKCLNRFNIGEHRSKKFNRQKLNDAKVLELRQEYRRTPYSIAERAKKLEVSRKTLGDALKGKTYSHVADPVQAGTIEAYRDLARVVDKPAKPVHQFNMPRKKPNTPKSVVEKRPRVISPKVKPVVTKTVIPVVVAKCAQQSVKEAPIYVEQKLPKTVVVDRSAELEKQKQARLFQIKMAAQRLDQQQGKNLTAFKKFALYHLHRLGYTYDSIKAIIRDLETEDMLKTVVRSYNAEGYTAERDRLIKTYGEDSKMLLAIKIHEVIDE